MDPRLARLSKLGSVGYVRLGRLESGASTGAGLNEYGADASRLADVNAADEQPLLLYA